LFGEKSARMFTIIGAVVLVSGIVLVALPNMVMSEGEGRLEAKVYSIDSFMTAVYKVYGNPKLGFWVAKTVIKNTGVGSLYDVKITYRIEGLTGWSEPREYKLIPPGGAVVDLYYPILTQPPDIETATPGKLYVKIEYKTRSNAEPVSETKTKDINILGKHDFIFSGIPPEENTGSFQDMFSNYPLLAAWVTPKDPVVEAYAGMANQLTGAGAGAALSDEEALAFLRALWDFSTYNGIIYQTESEAFWTGRSSQYVKYPRDVIHTRQGTCLDTSILFAALAMSQDLKALIFLMPGHAIPIIVLPSRQYIAIESTKLGEKVTFDEAVHAGATNVQKALQGPHLILDVVDMQRNGIVPPELPTLPPNVLEQWGYRLPGAGGGGAGGGAGGGGGGEAGGGGGGQQPPANTRTVTNPYNNLPWSITIPADWNTQNYAEAGIYEVDVVNPDNTILISIMWSQNRSANDLRSLMESIFNDYFYGYQVTTDNPNGALGNIRAETVVYTLGTGDIVIARYADVQGYGLVVYYFISQAVASQDTITAVDQIVQTFRIGG